MKISPARLSSILKADTEAVDSNQNLRDRLEVLAFDLLDAKTLLALGTAIVGFVAKDDPVFQEHMIEILAAMVSMAVAMGWVQTKQIEAEKELVLAKINANMEIEMSKVQDLELLEIKESDGALQPNPPFVVPYTYPPYPHITCSNSASYILRDE